MTREAWDITHLSSQTVPAQSSAGQSAGEELRGGQWKTCGYPKIPSSACPAVLARCVLCLLTQPLLQAVHVEPLQSCSG